MTITDGLKFGLGIAAALAGLWMAGWAVVGTMMFFDNQRAKFKAEERRHGSSPETGGSL